MLQYVIRYFVYDYSVIKVYFFLVCFIGKFDDHISYIVRQLANKVCSASSCVFQGVLRQVK